MSRYYKPYPPIKIHSSKAVSADEALNILSAYITNAETDDGQNSDATLAPGSGPIANTSGITVSKNALILHNLKRVQAALRGEDLPPPFQTVGGDDTSNENGAIVPETPVKNTTAEKRKRAAAVDENAEDWQDPEEYQEQQEDIVGEIDDRMPNVVDGAQAAANLTKIEKSMDKEARKKAKKERKNKDKKDREKKRRDAAET